MIAKAMPADGLGVARRPRIPPEYNHLSPLKTAAFLSYATVFAVVPSALASVVALSPWPLALRLALLVPLLCLAGHGLHLLGWVGHEGVHLNLTRNKRLSVFLGILFSATLPTYLVVGYGITHWNHHRYTNQESDPDTHIYPHFNNFWSRMFLSRSRGTRTYMKNTVQLALRRLGPQDYRMPLPEDTLVSFAWLNIVIAAAWVIVYIAIGIAYPVIGLVSIVLPTAMAYYFSGLRAYAEHAGTEAGTFRDTRSYTSWLYTLLFFGNNFHIEHHLYPAVPCYHLPGVHRWLRAQGVLDRARADVEPTFFGIFRYMTSRYSYPSPVPNNEIEDPFKAASP